MLNGCQTIKATNFFYQEYVKRNKTAPDIWSQIPISVRIVQTDDDELWREISEANNRQNSMKASALRANDPLQIRLENRFKDMRIFYERQEQAFEGMTRSDMNLIEDTFSNSTKDPMAIEFLAQTIVCMTNMPLAYATRLTEIFEQPATYKRVFSERNLQNLTFLVFARNVRNIVDLAAKDAIPENSRKYEGFRSVRYRDLLTRLVLRSVVAHWETQAQRLYGSEVIPRKGRVAADLKDFVRSVLKSMDYPILKVVGDVYGSREYVEWARQGDPALLKQTLIELKVDQIDIPTAVADIDYEMA